MFGIEPSRYSDNFTINPETGVLTNRGKLDREALDPDLDGRIELNVTATDMGTPQLSTMVPVIINVEASISQQSIGAVLFLMLPPLVRKMTVNVFF